MAPRQNDESDGSEKDTTFRQKPSVVFPRARVFFSFYGKYRPQFDSGAASEDIAVQSAIMRLFADLRGVRPAQALRRKRGSKRRHPSSSCSVLSAVLAPVCVASVKLLLTLRPLRGALWTVAFPTPVNATTDEKNDDMKPTRFTNEAQLKALFDHAVRAIGFYEAQRKEALMALESLRRALNNRPPKPPTP